MSRWPKKRQSVDVDGYHPTMVARLDSFFADPEVIAAKVKISSGRRTYKRQAWFYRRYKAGKGNLAANPDRVFGPPFKLADGSTARWHGSWHMPQADGYCHAVDLTRGKFSKKGLEAACNRHGLFRTVPSEWWHFQWRNSNGPFPVPDAIAPDFDFEAVDWPLTGLNAKSNVVTRKVVRAVQRGLKVRGYDPGGVDGLFGPRTRKALVEYRVGAGLVDDTLDETTAKQLAGGGR